MRIKKINAFIVGILFALAMILNQLVNYVLSYIFNLSPSLMIYLSGNLILARVVGICLFLIMGFLLGSLFAAVYNLMAKSKKCQLVLETA